MIRFLLSDTSNYTYASDDFGAACLISFKDAVEFYREQDVSNIARYAGKCYVFLSYQDIQAPESSKLSDGRPDSMTLVADRDAAAGLKELMSIAIVGFQLQQRDEEAGFNQTPTWLQLTN